MPNVTPPSSKYKLIGKNYTTGDLYAKVTGKAKYAEDFNAHPPQCADAPLLTIIATILFCDSAFSSAVDTNGRRSPVQCNCTRFSGTLLV